MPGISSFFTTGSFSLIHLVKVFKMCIFHIPQRYIYGYGIALVSIDQDFIRCPQKA